MTWAPDYVEVADLASYLHIDDRADDAFLATWVTTVSRNIDDHCGRQFGQVDAAEERYYTPVYDRHECASFVDIDDLQDITDLTVEDSSGVAVTDYVLLPRNAAAKGRPYEQLRLADFTGEIAVSARWGWSAVPAAVKAGVFLQGARLAARRDSPFGISGSPQEQGEIRLLAQLDPDFRTSLKPLCRRWWAA